MKFEKKYTEYWKNNIKNPIDGLAIAGSNEVNHFLPFLAIHNDINEIFYMADSIFSSLRITAD